MKRETIEALIARYIYTQHGTVETDRPKGEHRKFEDAGDLQDEAYRKNKSQNGDRFFESSSSSQVSFETYAAREEYRRLMETEANYNFLKDRLALAESLNVSLEKAREYQEELLQYKNTKEQATKLLCNYLNPRRDIDCDEEIVEIIELLFRAMVSRVKCLNISPKLLESEVWKENNESDNWEEEELSPSEV